MSEPLRIAVCEDMREDAELLMQCIRHTGTASKITIYASGEAFIKEYRKGLYHLVYLDVYMEGMTGLAVAAALREQSDGVPLVFITTSREHALEASRYRSILYIEKPVTVEAAAHTLSIAEAIRQRRENAFLSVTDNQRKRIDIPFEDIGYIDVLNHRCTVHLVDGGEVTLVTSATIDELDAALPKPPFLRCHRSYIVSLDYAHSVDKEYHAFIMKNGDRVNIRRGRLKQYEDAIKLRAIEKTGRDEG